MLRGLLLLWLLLLLLLGLLLGSGRHHAGLREHSHAHVGVLLSFHALLRGLHRGHCGHLRHLGHAGQSRERLSVSSLRHARHHAGSWRLGTSGHSLSKLLLQLVHVLLQNQVGDLAVSGRVKGLELGHVATVRQLLDVLLNRQRWRSGSLLILLDKTRQLFRV